MNELLQLYKTKNIDTANENYYTELKKWISKQQAIEEFHPTPSFQFHPEILHAQPMIINKSY